MHFKFRGQSIGNDANVADQWGGLVIVQDIGHITVDVNDVLDLRVANAGAIRLAYRARSD